MATKEKRIIQGYDIDDPKQKKELTTKVLEQLKQGVPMKKALGISDDMLESVYSLAYGKYQQGEYAAASHLFRYAMMLDPHTYKYALGLAAALHHNKEYQKAANIYVMASILEPRDPTPYFHSADCFLKINQPQLALAGLDMAIATASSDKRYSELKERAQLMKKTLQKQGGK